MNTIATIIGYAVIGVLAFGGVFSIAYRLKMKWFGWVPLIFIASIAGAQNTSTTTQIAHIDGIANCNQVYLTITRTTSDREVRTWVQVSVKECAPGETVPTVLIANRSQLIPDSDFIFTNNQVSLNSSLPEGKLSINWATTQTQHNSFKSSNVTEMAGQSTKRETQDQDTRSASGTGTIFGKDAAGRSGYIVLSVVSQR